MPLAYPYVVHPHNETSYRTLGRLHPAGSLPRV